jgi:hypothetical protein
MVPLDGIAWNIFNIGILTGRQGVGVMAFGIDDALTAATAGLKFTETLVDLVKRYRGVKPDHDLEELLGEVRNTALSRINDADLALTQFERTLVERGVDLRMRMSDVISHTTHWRPFEQYRVGQIHKRFNEFADSVYCAIGDIAALARCRGQTEDLGLAVVQSTRAKHAFQEKLLNAGSLKEQIELLRSQLLQQKVELSR